MNATFEASALRKSWEAAVLRHAYQNPLRLGIPDNITIRVIEAALLYTREVSVVETPGPELTDDELRNLCPGAVIPPTRDTRHKDLLDQINVQQGASPDPEQITESTWRLNPGESHWLLPSTGTAIDVAGVWVTYSHDNGPYAIALYSSCSDAARGAARQGYGQVAFWPFDTEFADAIKAWEAQ